MFAGSVRSFLHQGARVAVQFDAESLRNGFALGDQIVEQLTGWREARGGAMMQQRQSTDRIGGGIEDQFGPLRAARVFQGNHIHARARDQARQFLDFGHWRIRRLKRADPGITFNVEADVARSNGVSGRKCRTANYVCYVFRDDLFVAHAILHGANSAIFIEGMGCLRDRPASVDGFRGDNAKVTAWKLMGIAGGIQSRRKIGGSGNTETTPTDDFDMIFPDVVGPDLGLTPLSEVGGKDAADSAATDDADFKQTLTPQA